MSGNFFLIDFSMYRSSMNNNTSFSRMEPGEYVRTSILSLFDNKNYRDECDGVRDGAIDDCEFSKHDKQAYEKLVEQMKEAAEGKKDLSEMNIPSYEDLEKMIGEGKITSEKLDKFINPNKPVKQDKVDETQANIDKAEAEIGDIKKRLEFLKAPEYQYDARISFTSDKLARINLDDIDGIEKLSEEQRDELFIGIGHTVMNGDKDNPFTKMFLDANKEKTKENALNSMEKEYGNNFRVYNKAFKQIVNKECENAGLKAPYKFED